MISYWLSRENRDRFTENFNSTQPDTLKQHTEIKNALTRKLPEGCFTVEVRMSEFVPLHNWQQAGIILSEDTNGTAKAIRISLGYNDFFACYNEPAEIILQGMASTESGPCYSRAL